MLLLFSYVLRRFFRADGYWNDYDYSAERTEYLGTKLPLVFISFAIDFVGVARVAATDVDNINDDLPGYKYYYPDLLWSVFSAVRVLFVLAVPSLLAAFSVISIDLMELS